MSDKRILVTKEFYEQHLGSCVVNHVSDKNINKEHNLVRDIIHQHGDHPDYITPDKKKDISKAYGNSLWTVGSLRRTPDGDIIANVKRKDGCASAQFAVCAEYENLNNPFWNIRSTKNEIFPNVLFIRKAEEQSSVNYTTYQVWFEMGLVNASNPHLIEVPSDWSLEAGSLFDNTTHRLMIRRMISQQEHNQEWLKGNQ